MLLYLTDTIRTFECLILNLCSKHILNQKRPTLSLFTAMFYRLSNMCYELNMRNRNFFGFCPIFNKWPFRVFTENAKTKIWFYPIYFEQFFGLKKNKMAKWPFAGSHCWRLNLAVLTLEDQYSIANKNIQWNIFFELF